MVKSPTRQIPHAKSDTALPAILLFPVPFRREMPRLQALRFPYMPVGNFYSDNFDNTHSEEFLFQSHYKNLSSSSIL